MQSSFTSFDLSRIYMSKVLEIGSSLGTYLIEANLRSRLMSRFIGRALYVVSRVEHQMGIYGARLEHA